MKDELKSCEHKNRELINSAFDGEWCVDCGAFRRPTWIAWMSPTRPLPAEKVGLEKGLVRRIIYDEIIKASGDGVAKPSQYLENGVEAICATFARPDVEDLVKALPSPYNGYTNAKDYYDVVITALRAYKDKPAKQKGEDDEPQHEGGGMNIGLRLLSCGHCGEEKNEGL